MFTKTRHVQQNQHCVCDYVYVLALIITSLSLLLHGTTVVCKDSINVIIIHNLILALSLSSLSVRSDIILHHGPSLKKMQDTDVQQLVLLLFNN